MKMKILNNWGFLFLFACCICALSLQSCEKDNSPPSIRGTWKLVDLNGSGVTYIPSKIDHFKDSILINTYTLYGASFNVLLNFNQNSDEHLETGSYREIRTIDSMGIISTDEINHVINDSRDWMIKGDTLFFESNLFPQLIEILELNDSTLTLKERFDIYEFRPGSIIHSIGTEFWTYERVE